MFVEVEVRLALASDDEIGQPHDAPGRNDREARRQDAVKLVMRLDCRSPTFLAADTEMLS